MSLSNVIPEEEVHIEDLHISSFPPNNQLFSPPPGSPGCLHTAPSCIKGTESRDSLQIISCSLLHKALQIVCILLHPALKGQNHEIPSK